MDRAHCTYGATLDLGARAGREAHADTTAGGELDQWLIKEPQAADKRGS